MASLDLSRVMAKIDAIGEGFANREVRVGFFPHNYEDGTPVAYIAAIQEFGGTFEHPGGTPYKIGADGMATFVAKGSAGSADLPVTKAHDITIPARPFMRPTVQDKQKEWTEKIAAGMRKTLTGKITADQVLDIVGDAAATDMRKTIASVPGNWPPLAAATLAQRKAKGQGSSPLQATGTLYDEISHQVADAS